MTNFSRGAVDLGCTPPRRPAALAPPKGGGCEP
jgi:hypothetical protein